MICFPNAKINLGLNVVSKRTDGYHNIETIFYPVPFCDALEITSSKSIKGDFHQTGIKIEGEISSNLVIKAYNLLKRDFSIPEVDIYLYKKIPFGAGLGGGSSDAAFMLKLLNEFASLKLSYNQLEDYAGKLGADCPFFIKNKPVFAQGIGNEFTEINLSLKGYYLVIIKPTTHVSTKEAYENVKPQKKSTSLIDSIRLPINEWKNVIVNDFENSIFPKYPKIDEIKKTFYDKGAVYASMSGSGSSVFGIFNEVKPDLKKSYPDCFICRIEN